jgi:protein-arginine kinase activator protein McsA
LARKELQDAVEREDFEKAAELRDKLQDMENNSKTIA